MGGGWGDGKWLADAFFTTRLATSSETLSRGPLRQCSPYSRLVCMYVCPFTRDSRQPNSTQRNALQRTAGDDSTFKYIIIVSYHIIPIHPTQHTATQRTAGDDRAGCLRAALARRVQRRGGGGAWGGGGTYTYIVYIN